jgi:hypothetical protein
MKKITLIISIFLLISCNRKNNQNFELEGMIMSENFYNALVTLKKSNKNEYESYVKFLKEKYRKPILIDDYRECKEPDTSGNYMNRVLDELKDRGYAISGYNFGGNGFYIVTVVKPTGRIGSSEVKVLVNECGEILRIIE